MNKDSLPVYERAPTFEEVVAYATENGLYGKLNLCKFYDYYEKQGFLFKGLPMDWKAKMKKWAENQTSPVMETGKERAAKPKPAIDVHQLDTIQNILKGMALA